MECQRPVIGRDTFAALAPVLSFAMSPSPTVHGGQHDTKYVTFELLLHATFVADEIWGFVLEPARSYSNTEKSEAKLDADMGRSSRFST